MTASGWRRVFALALALAMTACVRVHAPDPKALPPRRDVRLTVDVAVSAIPAGTKTLVVLVPVPRDDAAQQLVRIDARGVGLRPSGALPDDSLASGSLIDSGTARARVVRDAESGNAALRIELPSPSHEATLRVHFDLSRFEQRGGGKTHPFSRPDETPPASWIVDQDEAVRVEARSIFTSGMTNGQKASVAWAHVLAGGRHAPDAPQRLLRWLHAGGVPARLRHGWVLPTLEARTWLEWHSEKAGWMPIDIVAGRFGTLDHDRAGITLGVDPANADEQLRPRARADGIEVEARAVVTFEDLDSL